MYYQKEERYRLTYISQKDGSEKRCYPRSKQKRDEQLEICRERGIKVISCQKLYPFNTYNNQHNFELIRNIALNELYDIYNGEKKVSAEEEAKLESLKERAENHMRLELPVAWLPWEEWKDAKELSQMAILHRQDTCIRNGRPDLVTYC